MEGKRGDINETFYTTLKLIDLYRLWGLRKHKKMRRWLVQRSGTRDKDQSLRRTSGDGQWTGNSSEKKEVEYTHAAGGRPPFLTHPTPTRTHFTPTTPYTHWPTSDPVWYDDGQIPTGLQTSPPLPLRTYVLCSSENMELYGIRKEMI